MIRKSAPPAMISHRGKEVDRLFWEPESRWYVATTRSQCELAVAERLADQRVSYYLPYEPVRRASGHRSHAGVRPILTGFIFLVANDEEFHTLTDVQGLARTIFVKDQTMLIGDLQRFHTLHLTAKFRRLEALQRLRKGDRVRIREGWPAAGVEGVVDSNDSTKIYLRVAMLGAASFTVEDPACLELLSKQR